MELLEEIRGGESEFVENDDRHYHGSEELDLLERLLIPHRKDKKKVKIICPINKDAYVMNRLAREILLDDLVRIAGRWHIGSLVIENFYDLPEGFNLMNGEEGEVVDGNSRYITVDFEQKGRINIKVALKKDAENGDDEVDFMDRILVNSYPMVLRKKDEITTAYLKESFAITVHDSQGSEWDHVIFYSTTDPSSFFNRNLGYTAISRAKKRLDCFTTRNFRKFLYRKPTYRY